MKMGLYYHCCRRQSGFTLVELLTAVAVLSILVAIGIPSYTTFVTKMRMEGEINALANSLNLARSEATKRGLTVSLCPGTSTPCQTTTTWTSGWQTIVTDGTTTTQVAVSQALGQGDTLTSSTSSYPQFSPMGYTFFSGTLSLHDPNNTSSLYRCIKFSTGSWQIVTGATCP